MKNYKDFEKIYIGCSDAAALVLSGIQNGKQIAELLNFTEDGYYFAYIVDKSAEIPPRYQKKQTYTNWLRIYDDSGKTLELEADTITVFRAGNFGVIIQKS